MTELDRLEWKRREDIKKNKRENLLLQGAKLEAQVKLEHKHQLLLKALNHSLRQISPIYISCYIKQIKNNG